MKPDCDHRKTSEPFDCTAVKLPSAANAHGITRREVPVWIAGRSSDASGLADRNYRNTAVVMLGAAALVGCGYTPSEPPAQVSNPSVTYTYVDDRQLVEATRSAAVHCNQFATGDGTHHHDAG